MALFKKVEDNSIETTETWQLWQKGRDFNLLRTLYSDTDRNYRFYNEDQWYGLKSGSVEPVSYNIIKPIVKYKVGVINSSLFAVNYSAENFDKPEFQKEAEKVCEKLNKHVAKIFENNKMDSKYRKVSKHACINSEGIIYVDVDDNNNPTFEIIKKNNILYGNENSMEIQNQPYILITKRVPLEEAREIARKNELKEEEILSIVGDNDTLYESGDLAKYEINDMVTIITKLWKKEGTVWFEKATKTVKLVEQQDTKLTLYPVAHFVWEELEGSARGQGEVKGLISNQIEINKTLMRRAVAVKMGAYPQKVANMDKIVNPSEIEKVGSLIKVKDASVEDVKKIYGYVNPVAMSPDSTNLQQELITTTRDLAGAGDVATGDINPEKASGRAILAVQQASQQPLTEQSEGLKDFSEDLARICFDIWKTYVTEEGLTVVEKTTVEEPDEYGNLIQVEKDVTYTISQATLQQMNTSAKIDVTPKSPYDKFALEMSLENLLNQEHIVFDEYVEALPFDSTMPKNILEKIIKNRKEQQKKTNELEKQGIAMQSQMNHYLNQNEEIDQIDQMGQAMIQQAMM